MKNYVKGKGFMRKRKDKNGNIETYYVPETQTANLNFAEVKFLETKQTANKKSFFEVINSEAKNWYSVFELAEMAKQEGFTVEQATESHQDQNGFQPDILLVSKDGKEILMTNWNDDWEIKKNDFDEYDEYDDDDDDDDDDEN